MNYMPLCGSDGETYMNDSDLRAKNICDRTNVKKVKNGPC
jgi:hypothetical protein